MSASLGGGRARVRGAGWVLVESCREVFVAYGRTLSGTYPAAAFLAVLDDGSGSWDEDAARAGIEWDYAARRPGESYPLDYQAALYWPEAGPLGCAGRRRRGGEHE